MVSPDPLSPLRCPRCERALEHKGTRKFHDGDGSSAFRALGELFDEEHDSCDVYVCPECGRVEFFVNGIGDELR